MNGGKAMDVLDALKLIRLSDSYARESYSTGILSLRTQRKREEFVQFVIDLVAKLPDN